MSHKVFYPLAAAVLLLGLLFFSVGGNLSVQAQQVTPGHVTGQASPQCEIFLFPMFQSKTGLPGETITYQLTLYNFNPYPDSFFLEISGETWNTSPEQAQVGPVPAWGSLPVTVTVLIPGNIQWQAAETVDVLARSMLHDTQVSNIAHLTTVVKNPLQLSLEPPSLESVQLPGQFVTQTMTIHNAYDFPLAYQLSGPILMPQDQWLSIPNASGVIPSKQSVTLPIVFNATLKRPGIYTQEIYLDSNAPDYGHITVPARMQVVDPPYLIYLPVLNK
jgi:hypothetical protein